MTKHRSAIACRWAIFLLCALGSISWLGTNEISASDKAPPVEPPLSALIVPEAIYSHGIAEVNAIAVVDKATLAKLSALFPKFAQQPASEVAGAWEAGWEIYFTFQGNRTVRVIVSANDNGQTWSTGSGDFATQGDFQAVLKGVQAKNEKDAR